MSDIRHSVLSDIRGALSKKAPDEERAKAVAERLGGRPTGIIPKRGQLKQATRWLKLSMKKGHAGAEALLGRLYFESGLKSDF